MSIFIRCLFAIALAAASPPAGQAAAEGFTLTAEEIIQLDGLRGVPIKLAYSQDLFYKELPDGQRVGMLTPLLDLLEKRWGLQVTPVKLAWGEALRQADAQGVDFYGLTGLNADRREQYNFIGPFYRADAAIVSRAEDPLGSLLSLSRKRLGLLNKSVISPAMNVYLHPGGQARYFSSTEEMTEALEKGEIDCLATVDGAEVELLRRPGLRYEFTIRNFYVDQGLVSARPEMRPLALLINRYLAGPEGEAFKAAVAEARRRELFRVERERLADDIAYVKKSHQTVRMYDRGELYPLSFMENGGHQGIQADINRIFEELAGVPVSLVTEGGEGQYPALDLMRTGDIQVVSGSYPAVRLWRDPSFDYSEPVFIDTMRTYSYGRPKTQNLSELLTGSTANAASYINWEIIADQAPKIYGSRRELLEALKNGEVDAAFVSEMSFNYYYTILDDYNLREVGRTAAEANIQMIYGKQNPEINRLFNAAVHLYQLVYPEAKINWEYQAAKYKTDGLRLRDARNRLYLALTGIFVAMAALLFFSVRRHARYDRQISMLIRRQQNFDLLWGDLKTRRIVSKGDHPFFRTWGLDFPGAACSLDDLSRAFGWDLHHDYRADLGNMKENRLDVGVSEKRVVVPKTGRSHYYRRYLHRLNDSQFMVCIQDVTDEMTRVERLREAASTDFLSTLLNRRAMDDLLRRKSEELKDGGRRAFLIMFDIDDFKVVNDSYGHDVGDDLLKTVSRVIRDAEGCGESTSRWGGEEFLALVECADQGQAERIANSVVQDIAAQEMRVMGTDKTFRVTISAGVAELDPDRDYNLSIRLADQALYESKRSGKNKVRTWPCPQGPRKPER